MIYVVDEKQIRHGARYTLLRLIELVPYTAQDGTQAYANRYKTFIAKDGTITDIPLSEFPDWAAANEEEWVIPNVDRLLIGRYRSFTLNRCARTRRRERRYASGRRRPSARFTTSRSRCTRSSA